MRFACRPVIRGLAAVVLLLGLVAVGELTAHIQARADVPPLPAGTLCQGPQASQPASGPTHVINIVLENESTANVESSPDATFERGTLDAQCGTFSQTAMHSTTHYSEANYFALTTGLNAAINSGADAQANFGLSDCAPSATPQPPSTSCAYGSGQFPTTTPSIYSLVEAQYGVTGWSEFSDDMGTNCNPVDGNRYATDSNGTSYNLYATRHNPALYFPGSSCATQNVPSGAWQQQQGPLYTALMSGTMPYYSFVEPNDVENGHDPVSVTGHNGVTTTIAGGTSQVGNIDSYLSSFMTLVQQSPQYLDGSLVVMITFDEGAGGNSTIGDGVVGENCADPNISALAMSCQVKTWIVGRYVPNYTYSTYMNQFGLLAAEQRILNLPPLLGHAGDATTPDIVNGTAAIPNPFNLAPTGEPTVPSAPTSASAIVGDSSASVSFAAPFSDGESAVTGYTVTATPGGVTATGSASPILVSGLANGTAYTFTVHATNAVGDGPESDPSAPVTPGAASPPGAPTGLAASAGDGRVGLSWVAPTVNGGAAVTDYVVQYRPSGTTTWTSIDEGSANTFATVTGLTNNSAYDFAVQAVNSAGPGAASSVLTATPSAQLLPDPGFESGNGGWIAFKIGTLSRVSSPVHGGTSALSVASPQTAVSLVGLTQNSVVTNTTAGFVYTASCYVQPTAASLNVQMRFLEYTPSYSSSVNVGNTPVMTLPTGVWTQVSVSGTALRTGERMIPQIYSTNETSTNGSMLYDDCSVVGGTPVAPTAPDAPTGVSAVAGDGSATVAFTAPANNGSPITGYTVSSSPGGFTGTGSTSPIVVSGLTDGTPYTFTVTATNGVGTGPASTPSNSVTPVAPAPPSNELLPDPGFESSNGGWIAFKIGTLTRVSSPVHGGTSALRVTSPQTAVSLVGLTQNSVVTNTTAGLLYTASCYVQPTSPSLNVQMRLLEYTHSYSSNTTVATVSLSSLPTGSWTLVRVSGTAVTAGDRMIPQIYSTNQTSTNSSMLYDDCSVTHN